MKKWLIVLGIAAAAGSIAYVMLDPAALTHSLRERNDRIIAEQLAYHYGVAAYLYGYPIVDMLTQMHNETHRTGTEQQTYAPVNRLYRFPDLIVPETAGDLRAPNADTLYFSGWYDVSHEPLIIHTPDTDGRYYTISVTNLYAEVTHIGRRTTGTAEAYFALTPPHWHDALPDGVTAIPVETNRGWLLGRMYVAGRDDFAAAKSLVDDIWLASLSEFTPGRRPAPRPQLAADRIDPRDTLDFFDVLNDGLRSLPPRPQEAAHIAQFDRIGVGPAADFDAARMDDATRRGLEDALRDGRKIIGASTFRSMTSANGWMISLDIGRYGHDFFHRASVVKGGYGNLPEESVYAAALFDSDGDMLTGRHAYALTFPAAGLPPVRGFWSLTAYTLDARLVPNEMNRYSIGDRTPELHVDADGSLRILLQHAAPSAKRTNWLPAPNEPFFVVLRMYEPDNSILRGDYRLPPMEKAAR